MFNKGVTLVVLTLFPLMASAQICIPYIQDCDGWSYYSTNDSDSASWLTMISCTANQVPKLEEGFNTPLYQYIFEVFARNTHLLPLGVPIKSESEDFETTALYEKCLWGGASGVEEDLGDNTIDWDDKKSNNIEKNDLIDNREGDSAYHQLFSSRQGGFDSLTGLTLLGGKIIASVVGYIVYALRR